MEPEFDLLGDPIPEGRGKPGRPQHIATVENRRKVMLLLGLGRPNTRIAAALGISVPTLIKNYFTGLGRKDRIAKMAAMRDAAKERVESLYLHRVWSKAMDGDTSALRLMGQILEREIGLMPRTSEAVEDDEPEAVQLGKKEQAERDARNVPDAWQEVLGGSKQPN